MGATATRNTVIEDVRQLSSGTVARLCGSARYDDIEAYQAALAEFVAGRPDAFETWTDAWLAFLAR